VCIYRLHDTTGDDLGLLEHPATSVAPGDVVHLSDGREALVTARAETNDEAVMGAARSPGSAERA